MATHWGNWAKLFFDNKGVAVRSTDLCAQYRPTVRASGTSGEGSCITEGNSRQAS